MENLRAAELFGKLRNSVRWQTNRLFAVILPLQWLFISVAAYFAASESGASNGEQLAQAILVSGVIVSLPFLLALKYPNETATGFVVAAGQMVLSGLIIHLTGGRIATHFHVFVSLFVLSFYRDWRVLIPATAVVVGDQIFRGWLLPFSIYGITENAGWRVAEHLTWVLVTDFLLLFSIRQSISTMTKIAVRTAELEDKEERYRAVVEQTDDGIALIELKTMRILEANPAFCRLLGCASVEEVRKLSAYDFNADEHWLRNYQVKEQGTKKTYFSGEKNYRRVDGSLIPVEVSASLIEYNGKKVYCVNAKDITERKADEARLTRLAIVAEKTQNAVIITDDNGCIQWVNEGFTRLTGYGFDEVVGNLGYLLQGAATDAEMVETIRTTMWARKPFSGEIYNYRKDGEGFWMSISITPIFKDDGIVEGFVAVQMDVTERKAMEEKLRRAHDQLEHRVTERTAELLASNNALKTEINERRRAEVELKEAQQFLRTVIDSVPNLIFVKDNRLRYTLANNATAEFYGTTVENVVGKTLAEFHDYPQENAQIAADDKDVIESFEEKFIAEEQLTDGAGKPRWLQIVKRPLIGDDEESFIIGVATDLTERKLLENRLLHSHKMESIGQLAAGVAHEINTPTQYVGDNTRFVRDSFADITQTLEELRELAKSLAKNDEQQKLFDEIEENFRRREIEFLTAEIPKAVEQSLEGVARISKIVGSMRTFAHPGAIEKIASNLNAAIESTISVAQSEWKYFADVETRLDKDLPPVPCLLDEINQVVLNMIINATHAIADTAQTGTHGKGKITITTTHVENWAEIRIADTGAGIPAEVQNRIFDPFFTTKEVGKGTGQGLAISHNVVVKKHGGELTFETAPSKGTTFIIRLPLDQSPNTDFAV